VCVCLRVCVCACVRVFVCVNMSVPSIYRIEDRNNIKMK
jgi:hypothetical protein